MISLKVTVMISLYSPIKSHSNPITFQSARNVFKLQASWKGGHAQKPCQNQTLTRYFKSVIQYNSGTAMTGSEMDAEHSLVTWIQLGNFY